jgi:hypothetical protein
MTDSFLSNNWTLSGYRKLKTRKNHARRVPMASMNVKAFLTPCSRHATANRAFHGWEGFQNSFSRLRNIAFGKSAGNEFSRQINSD